MTRPTCNGRTKAGKPCQSTILNPDGFCEAHGPGGNLKMKLRAKMGSMKAHHGKRLDPEALGELVTVRDAQRWLRMIALGVTTGKLKAQEGTTGVRAIGAWLKAESDRLKAEELEAIQAELAGLKRTNSPGTAPAGLEKRFSLFPLGTE